MALQVTRAAAIEADDVDDNAWTRRLEPFCWNICKKEREHMSPDISCKSKVYVGGRKLQRYLQIWLMP